MSNVPDLGQANGGLHNESDTARYRKLRKQGKSGRGEKVLGPWVHPFISYELRSWYKSFSFLPCMSPGQKKPGIGEALAEFAHPQKCQPHRSVLKIKKTYSKFKLLRANDRFPRRVLAL